MVIPQLTAARTASIQPTGGATPGPHPRHRNFNPRARGAHGDKQRRNQHRTGSLLIFTCGMAMLDTLWPGFQAVEDTRKLPQRLHFEQVADWAWTCRKVLAFDKPDRRRSHSVVGPSNQRETLRVRLRRSWPRRTRTWRRNESPCSTCCERPCRGGRHRVRGKTAGSALSWQVLRVEQEDSGKSKEQGKGRSVASKLLDMDMKRFLAAFLKCFRARNQPRQERLFATNATTIDGATAVSVSRHLRRSSNLMRAIRHSCLVSRPCLCTCLAQQRRIQQERWPSS